MMSIRWCGTRARSAADGLAVPTSMPRYTSAESTLTISTGSTSAMASAAAVLPEAVGPARHSAGAMSGGLGGRGRMRLAVTLHQRPGDGGHADAEGAEPERERIDRAVQMIPEPQSDRERSGHHHEARERRCRAGLLGERPDRARLAAGLVDAVADRVRPLRHQHRPHRLQP